MVILVPFLVKLGITVVVATIIAIIHDLVVDWIEVRNVEITTNPSTLAGNMQSWDIRVKMELKDESWFWGNWFGPRRIMSWRIVVEPDSAAVNNGWVQPRNFVKQGGPKEFAYIDQKFSHTWDPPIGLHGSTVKVYIRNKEIINQRFTFVRTN
ncbi:hypothetical protein [Ulvibacterium marinum]|uniref:Uncharacterized protein n=1 Tax=Ulvibacterium marinum TaxID=2419782 RepID=A0A3B0BXX8_9FLAO|nr:hypothetical protein [Ulvibacterium marinum]RKN77842.1 hypothetical protein D7Z94_21625 [Ulvibacterium marinum]